MMSRVQKVVTCLHKKTVVITFTKSRLKDDEYPNKLIVDGENVKFSTAAKYLGVTLDSNLLCTEHFNNQYKKCKQYLFTLKRSVQKSWGPKPIYIIWVYVVIVRSRLCYGSIGWGHTTRPDKRIEKP